MIPFKRVDEWRFVDLAQPPSAVETQLKRHFERLLPNAQYSAAYTCVAREDANFRKEYAAMPEEELGQLIAGRCGAPSGGTWASVDQISDGTILDNPLSPQVLNDVSTQLLDDLPPFTVFGITARYVGPNALVMLETASPGATIHIDEPDAKRQVRVRGRILGDAKHATARINQGELRTATCDADADAELPDYTFRCPLAAGDAEAWGTVSADDGEGGSENPLVDLPARDAGWTAPVEYRRKRLTLPEQVDTPTALVMAINELRARLDREKLTFAADQSRFMHPSYDQAFALNAKGDWLGDYVYRQQMLRGDRVDGDVSWGRITSSIAFDGDAADWLSSRLRLPISRDTLMNEHVDQIAIATHGDASIGFGAAAVVYTLLTPKRENTLVEKLAQSIAKLRGKRPTQRLDNPRELEVAAREVAAGHQPLSAFGAALRQANLGRKDNQYLAAIVLPLESTDAEGSKAFKLLLNEPVLTYGIVGSRVRSSDYNWVSPFALVWYITKQRPEREARRDHLPGAELSSRQPGGLGLAHENDAAGGDVVVSLLPAR
ncbi:MAG TPA: hypothetical protein VNG33_20415 [Polyangiaceae bacterium]|nr:hypothetical protein [Polyangiaceae bacterium]